MVPSDGKGGQRESKVRVRAHFDYFPENDPYIPCKEAGLGFVRGEVLHIVSQVRCAMILGESRSKNEISFHRTTHIGGKRGRRTIEAREPD